MTNLPSQHPTLSLHLTDLTLTPLISSSSSPSHLESLTSLATTALTCQAAMQRIKLGRPQRVMVEYPERGALVLQSYLDPAEPLPLPLPHPPSAVAVAAGATSSRSASRPETPHKTPSNHSRPSTTISDAVGAGAGGGDAVHGNHGRAKDTHQQGAPAPASAPISGEDAPPMLVSVVVAASADQAREAKRAAEKLERVGREFQREWLEDSNSGRVGEDA